MTSKEYGILCFQNGTQDFNMSFRFSDKPSHWGWPFQDTEDLKTRNEITYESIENEMVGPGNSYAYGQTATTGERSGMEGTVDIYLMQSAAGASWQKAATVFYSCPWGNENALRIFNVADLWSVTSTKIPRKGPLGRVDIHVRDNVSGR